MDGDKYKKILLIQLGKTSEVILSTPVITILRDKYRFAAIHFLTENAYADILTGHPDLTGIITFSRKSPVSVFSAVKRLRREKYDLVFDFQGSRLSAFFTLFSGAGSRAGYHKGRLESLAYTDSAVISGGPVYLPYVKMALLKIYGIKGEELRPYIFVPKDAREAAKNFFSGLNMNGNTLLVGLGVRSHKNGGRAKNWTREKFAELGKMISKNYRADILILWRPGEERERDFLKLLLAGRAIIAPAMDIKILAAFVKKCDLVISGFGAVFQVAVAMAVPTLTVFGPTPPEYYLPPEDEFHKVVRAQVDCLGCGKQSCRELSCMKNLSANDVYRAADLMLLNVLRRKILRRVKTGLW